MSKLFRSTCYFFSFIKRDVDVIANTKFAKKEVIRVGDFLWLRRHFIPDKTEPPDYRPPPRKKCCWLWITLSKTVLHTVGCEDTWTHVASTRVFLTVLTRELVTDVWLCLNFPETTASSSRLQDWCRGQLAGASTVWSPLAGPGPGLATLCHDNNVFVSMSCVDTWDDKWKFSSDLIIFISQSL